MAKRLTLRQHYIAQLLSGTDAGLPDGNNADVDISVCDPEWWGEQTARRIFHTVDSLLDMTGDDGGTVIETD